MKRFLFLFLTVSFLCFFSYLAGYNRAFQKMKNAHIKEMEEKNEVMKNENQKRGQIWAQPHASSHELIGLFLQNKL